MSNKAECFSYGGGCGICISSHKPDPFMHRALLIGDDAGAYHLQTISLCVIRSGLWD